MEWEDVKSTIWDDLANKKTKDPHMAMTEQITENGKALYYICIFTSVDGSFHLLIEPEKPMNEQLLDPKAAGLRLGLLKNHLISGRERQDYIDLKCTSKQHKESFTELIKQISRSILNNGISPTRAINQTINRWKKFWGKPNEEIMNEYSQLGLIGELLILEKMLNLKVLDPVSKWSGPAGGIHDFEFGKSSFEVKATLKSRHQHIINGLEQLEPTNDKGLYVVSFIMQKVSDNGITLTKKVNDILDLLNEMPEQLDMFNERILITGYRPDHEIYYDKLNVKFIDIKIFPVNEEFPRLVKSSLKTSISPRITNIRYMVDCEGLKEIIYFDTEFLRLINDK